MANKKTNKFASADTAVKEANESPVQAKPEETAAEKAPEVQQADIPAVSAEAKPDKPVKKPAKSAPAKAEEKPCEPAASDKLVIEFSGANYESSEIVQKCKAAFSAEYPKEKLAGIEVYINVSERRAYYVANGRADGRYIEL